MYELGIEIVIMEVSSQSLKLDRVAGIDFYAGIFTNLSEEHISKNEHKDMQEYFESKMRLFNNCEDVKDKEKDNESHLTKMEEQLTNEMNAIKDQLKYYDEKVNECNYIIKLLQLAYSKF